MVQVQVQAPFWTSCCCCCWMWMLHKIQVIISQKVFLWCQSLTKTVSVQAGGQGPWLSIRVYNIKLMTKLIINPGPAAEAQKPPSINKRHNGPVGGRRALICTLCSLLAGNNTPGINIEASDESSGLNFECLVKCILRMWVGLVRVKHILTGRRMLLNVSWSESYCPGQRPDV